MEFTSQTKKTALYTGLTVALAAIGYYGYKYLTKKPSVQSPDVKPDESVKTD